MSLANYPAGLLFYPKEAIMSADPSKVLFNSRALSYMYREYRQMSKDARGHILQFSRSMERDIRERRGTHAIMRNAKLSRKVIEFFRYQEFRTMPLAVYAQNRPIVPNMGTGNYYLYSTVLRKPPGFNLDSLVMDMSKQIPIMMALYNPALQPAVDAIMNNSRLTVIEQRSLFRHPCNLRVRDLSDGTITTPITNQRPISPTLILNLYHSNLRAAELYTVLYPNYNLLSGMDLPDVDHHTLAVMAATYMTPHEHNHQIYQFEGNESTFSYTTRPTTAVFSPQLEHAQAIREELHPYFTEAVVTVGDEDYIFPAGRRRSLYEIATDPVILQNFKDDKLDIYHIAHMCGFSMELFLYLFIFPIHTIQKILASAPPHHLPFTAEEVRTTHNQASLGLSTVNDRNLLNVYKSMGLHYEFYEKLFPFVTVFHEKHDKFIRDIVPNIDPSLSVSHKYLKIGKTSPRK
jgi:hypothetical protein